MLGITDEIQEVGHSTKQELYDGKVYWWFEDEKDLKDDWDKRRNASWTHTA